MKGRAARTLIREAEHLGIRLWVENNQLHYKAQNGGIPATLRAALRSRREELIGELSTPVFKKRDRAPEVVRYPEFWKDFWDETQANPALANAIHLAIRLSGPVRLEWIDSALRRLISRYDLLRSRVELEHGVPCLRFDEHHAMPIELADVSGSTAADRSDLAKTLVQQAIYAPLENGRLHRARVIRISDSEYVVAMVLHHFVADPVSLAIVGDELIAGLHDGSGEQSSTDERPIQYADYLLGMSEWLSGEGLKYRLAYWKENMQGAPPVRFPPAPISTFGAELACMSIQINAALRARAARTAAVSQIPLAVVLLAAKFATLANTLKSRDLVTIIIHNGRDDPALRQLVGLTLNCFPVRVSVLPGMSYAELLASVKEAYLLARDYQVPWGLLMRSLAEIGVTCVAPIFNYVPLPRAAPNTPSSSGQDAGLEVEHLGVEGPAATNSVDWKSHEFEVLDSGADLHVTVNYMPSRYAAAAVNEFAAAFLLCLETMTRDPTRLI